MGSSQFPDVSQGSQSLLHSTRERLKLWDITDEQIKKLDETGEVTKTLTFYSPVSGFVTERKVFPQTAVTPDMDLYSISDLSTNLVERRRVRVRSTVCESGPDGGHATELLRRQVLHGENHLHLPDCRSRFPRHKSAYRVSESNFRPEAANVRRRPVENRLRQADCRTPGSGHGFRGEAVCVCGLATIAKS
jgi:Barrel-sandwich domain of CusB or HlyD membrane-fusion